MTVCVAVICNGGGGILTASDTMMSWGAGLTGETSLKYDPLHARWGVMLAGDDIAPAEPMISILRGILREFERPSVADVEEAIRTSWRAVKNQIAETHVLSPYALDMSTFVKTGRDRFGDVTFAEMCAAIERASEFSCQLLVYGFNEFDHGVLLVVVHPGEPVNFERLGFAAIGSGRDSAMASLMWDPAHKSYHSVVDGLYRICAAKFMSETAHGVGKDTVVCAYKSDGLRTVLTHDEVQQIRELWDTEGRPRIPKPHRLIKVVNPFGDNR